MHKLNIAFSPEESEALQRVAGKLNGTQVGVIRQAVAILDMLVSEREQGNAAGIIRGQTVLREIVGVGWPRMPAA